MITIKPKSKCLSPPFYGVSEENEDFTANLTEGKDKATCDLVLSSSAVFYKQICEGKQHKRNIRRKTT